MQEIRSRNNDNRPIYSINTDNNIGRDIFDSWLVKRKKRIIKWK